MVKVAKFGGSSLANTRQFQKVKAIIEADPTRQIVVVSALGKSQVTDDKITDLLYILYAHMKHGVSYADLWQTIAARFMTVKTELGLQFPMEEALGKLYQEIQKETVSEDYLVSRGEYLTALLMSEYLGFTFVDAKEIIRYGYDGKIDYLATASQFQVYRKKYAKILVPGFYGAYPNQQIKLMSRGGSDVTGAILARVAQATLYENWTDVSGILLADPRLIDRPERVSFATYQELQELSFMGANVLHEEAILPVQEVKIPIQIKNTNCPQDPGTLISETAQTTRHNITGIAGKKGYIALVLGKRQMISEIGFLYRAMEIIKNHEIFIEYILSGYDNVAIILPKKEVELSLYQLMAELKATLHLDSLEILEDIALVVVVGRSAGKNVNLSANVLGILGAAGIDVGLVSQSTAELNIVLGVKCSDFAQTIQKLYAGLVRGGDA